MGVNSASPQPSWVAMLSSVRIIYRMAVGNSTYSDHSLNLLKISQCLGCHDTLEKPAIWFREGQEKLALPSGVPLWPVSSKPCSPHPLNAATCWDFIKMSLPQRRLLRSHHVPWHALSTHQLRLCAVWLHCLWLLHEYLSSPQICRFCRVKDYIGKMGVLFSVTLLKGYTHMELD